MSTFQPRRDKLVRTEGLTRAHALGASPHAYGVPVGLLASRTLMSQSPTGSSGRRVYCSAMSAKMEHPQGRAPRSLPYQGSPSLSTGWMPEMVEAEGLAPSQPARAARLQRAAIAVVRLAAQRAPARLTHPLRLGLRHLRASRSVCHASESGGSSGIRTRGLLLMRELR